MRLDDLHQLGERIRAARERLGLTQRDIAGALQVSNQAVSKWECGENAPDIDVLAGLSRLLGVSVDALLGTQGREGEVFDATVYAAAMKGSTRRLATFTERDAAVWLNGLLCHMTEAVLRHDGVPVKYTGDGLLAFFAGTGHGDRAVHAARLTKAVLGADGCVGLHTGRVYLGRLGHVDYAQRDIIGPTVNTAVRVLQWAMAESASGAVASAAVVEGLSDAALAGSIGAPRETHLKGLEQPIPLYELAAES